MPCTPIWGLPVMVTRHAGFSFGCDSRHGNLHMLWRCENGYRLVTVAMINVAGSCRMVAARYKINDRRADLSLPGGSKMFGFRLLQPGPKK